mmetsp:Transcript_25018/g.51674  ORF Transcript_25018/g.51674 Transcript_25018/m.51674 type:complete len:219 (-) Transcript_25018:211-867(-)
MEALEDSRGRGVLGKDGEGHAENSIEFGFLVKFTQTIRTIHHRKRLTLHLKIYRQLHTLYGILPAHRPAPILNNKIRLGRRLGFFETGRFTGIEGGLGSAVGTLRDTRRGRHPKVGGAGVKNDLKGLRRRSDGGGAVVLGVGEVADDDGFFVASFEGEGGGDSSEEAVAVRREDGGEGFGSGGGGKTGRMVGVGCVEEVRGVVGRGEFGDGDFEDGGS